MNLKHKYEIGKAYGLKRLDRLTTQNGRMVAHVTCVLCGRQSVVKPSSLFNQKCTSCMCRSKKVGGESGSRLYGIYHNMKYRCHAKTANEYENYGGRGIKVCDEWLGPNGYNNFKQWAIDNGYNDTLTIDRIDGDGMYEPNNCRWVSLSENVAHANRCNRKQHRKSNRGAYYAEQDGRYIVFENASEFARNHNLNADTIRRKAYSSGMYEGWHFGFVEDLNEEPQSTIENPYLERVEYSSGESPLLEAPSTTQL